MSKRKILKRGKKPIKNPELLRGGNFGGGSIKKKNNSWAEGVKPPTMKAAKKIALKATTNLHRPNTPSFKNAILASRVPKTAKKISKGMQMLKKMASPVPKNVRPAKTIKRSAPKR